MSRFVVLLNYTEQGLSHIKDSPGRADTFRKLATESGVTIDAIFWTLGGFDGVLVFNAPDESTAVGLILALGKKLNVQTQMLRAFVAEEFQSILDAMPE